MSEAGIKGSYRPLEGNRKELLFKLFQNCSYPKKIEALYNYIILDSKRTFNLEKFCLLFRVSDTTGRKLIKYFKDIYIIEEVPGTVFPIQFRFTSEFSEYMERGGEENE